MKKYIVYGEFGGSFSNIKDAKKCAMEASKTAEHNYKESVCLFEDGRAYIDYEHGICVRNDWKTQRKYKSTGYIRRIDWCNRITLPVATLRKFGIKIDDQLEIFIDTKCNAIVLKKVEVDPLCQ